MDYFIELLEQYTSENPLKVICLAPMHDISNIPVHLYQNMDLFCSGGGGM
mgnify:CR=1 FL=1